MCQPSKTRVNFRWPQRHDKPLKKEKKSLLNFFHVCPLVLHERMGGKDGKAVYKFVFACPGKAAELVS